MNLGNIALAFALAAVSSIGCAADAGEDADIAEGAASRKKLDNIGAPTDTKIVLSIGDWHDNVLSPTEGWHAYHYTPEKTGYVRIVMRAKPGDATMWSYLRIEHEDPTGQKPWLHNTAAVGNRTNNECEVIMMMIGGEKYDVITTSQFNLTEAPNAKVHKSNGDYTVGVLPIDSTMKIPE